MNRFSAAAIAERLLKKGAIQSLTEIREKINKYCEAVLKS